MSNLGLFAGSSFMHIFMSLQMWGEMPGGMVGRKPSKATWEPKQTDVWCCSRDTPGCIKAIIKIDCNLMSSANLHANFHVGQVSVRHLSGHQLPQQDGKAPHVCWPTVDLFRLLLQGWKSQRVTSVSKHTEPHTACLYLLQLTRTGLHLRCANIQWLLGWNAEFVTYFWTSVASNCSFHLFDHIECYKSVRLCLIKSNALWSLPTLY